MKKISSKKILLVIKNNYSINRSLPLILALLVCILGSVVGAMPISDVEARYALRLESGFATYEEYYRSVKNVFDSMLGMEGVFSIMTMIVAFALAFFSTIALMGFMRDKSGTDFYHALSLNRKEIYLANFITAFINNAVTLILSQLLGLFFMALIAKEPTYSFGQMLIMQLPVMAIALIYLALFIAIALISTVISGTIFSSLITFTFINFYIPATVLAVSVAGNQLFNTKLMEFLEHKPHIYPYSSPFIRYIFGISGEEYLPFTALSITLLVLGIIFTLWLGIYLYTKKKNENSLKPITFNLFKRPLQYLIAFDAILLGATFFDAITNSLIWGIVGGAIALLFTFIATNAFFDKSFTGVFKKSKHMAFILVATLIFGIIFVADAFGIYKEVKPDIANVQRADVYINYSTEGTNYNYDFYFDANEKELQRSNITESMKDGGKKELLELYSFIKELQEIRRTNDYKTYDKTTDENLDTISVSLNFKCKNDFAYYYAHVYIFENEEGFDELKAMLDNLKNSYSHTLGYSNHQTGEWIHEEIIK